jgi:uncharacterized protein (TIGR03086 family)
MPGEPVKRPVDLLIRTATVMSRLVAGVDDRDLHKSTPCPGWDVAQLVEHVTDIAVRCTQALAGSPPGVASGPAGSYDSALTTFIETASVRGALDGQLETFMGTMSGAQLAMALTMDGVVHCWDLATATGQRLDLAPDLVEVVYATYQPDLDSGIEPVPTTEQLRAYGSLGPEVEVAPDAPTLDKLLGLFGRTAAGKGH